MTSNQDLITSFYSAFQKKDFKTMQSSYAENATFNDPVFENLNAQQVKAMWEMLIKNGEDLSIKFENITSDDEYTKARWTANYTFKLTGKKVINIVDATFKIKDQKIIAHYDQFDFHKWAGQALGINGKLFGWMPFMRRRVGLYAMKNLKNFMEQNNADSQQ